MNRFTTLALAALLTPALTLGIGSVFAEDRDADRQDQARDTVQPGMTSGEDRDADRQDQSRPTGQPGMVSGEDRENPDTHTRYDDADDAEAHLTGKPEGGFSADELIGQDVKHRDSDEDVGTVNDLLIDKDGNVVAVVIGTGGRLGIGEKDVAVNWNQVERSIDGDEISLFIDMDEDALKDAPEYEAD